MIMRDQDEIRVVRRFAHMERIDVDHPLPVRDPDSTFLPCCAIWEMCPQCLCRLLLVNSSYITALSIVCGLARGTLVLGQCDVGSC